MEAYKKPARWADPAGRLFPYPVGFTAPPHDISEAPGRAKEIYRIALPHYEHMHARRLTAAAAE
jgi:hypothetical protein